MYESPINIILGNLKVQRDGEIYRAVQECGINVDKAELLKALKYDRDQYDKGYKDGIREFAKRMLCIPISSIPEIREFHTAYVEKAMEEMGVSQDD